MEIVTEPAVPMGNLTSIYLFWNGDMKASHCPFWRLAHSFSQWHVSAEAFLQRRRIFFLNILSKFNKNVFLSLYRWKHRWTLSWYLLGKSSEAITNTWIELTKLINCILDWPTKRTLSPQAFWVLWGKVSKLVEVTIKRGFSKSISASNQTKKRLTESQKDNTQGNFFFDKLPSSPS